MRTIDTMIVNHNLQAAALFNHVPLKGKEVNIDYCVEDANDYLFNIQTKIESVLTNGDMDQARKDIIRRNLILKINLFFLFKKATKF